jgi:hypothetical protein
MDFLNFRKQANGQHSLFLGGSKPYYPDLPVGVLEHNLTERRICAWKLSDFETINHFFTYLYPRVIDAPHLGHFCSKEGWPNR